MRYQMKCNGCDRSCKFETVEAGPLNLLESCPFCGDHAFWAQLEHGKEKPFPDTLDKIERSLEEDNIEVHGERQMRMAAHLIEFADSVYDTLSPSERLTFWKLAVEIFKYRVRNNT